jgi:esterase/lipase superfamily enzyme
MMRYLATLSFVTLLALLIATPLTAEVLPYSITGTVAAAGIAAPAPATPISSVTVSLYVGNVNQIGAATLITETATDVNGRFLLSGLALDSTAAYTIVAYDQVTGRRDSQLIVFPSDPAATTITSNITLRTVIFFEHAARSVGFVTQSIFFVTERAPGAVANTFADDRSVPWKTTYGTIAASLPEDTYCRAPTSTFWRCQQNHVQSTPFSNAMVPNLTQSSLIDQIRARYQASKSKRVLVFVHGFNVGFTDAVAVAAQLGFNAQPFDGPIVLFSWPSRHDVALYGSDSNNSELAGDDLRGFLQELVKAVGTEKVNVVAHSMGNRVLTFALRGMALTPADAVPQLGQVVMAAPDVDLLGFGLYADAIGHLAHHFTAYESSHDQALMASRCLNGGYLRLGTFLAPLAPISGFDLIDTSPINTDFLGHGYFLGSPQVNADIDALLNGTARTAVSVGSFYRIGTGNAPFFEEQTAQAQEKICDAALALLQKVLDHQ